MTFGLILQGFHCKAWPGNILSPVTLIGMKCMYLIELGIVPAVVQCINKHLPATAYYCPEIFV
jgi:hypothetical protein